MAMKIVILEDNEERQALMRDCLSDRFHQYEAVFFKNAAATIEYLKQHLRNTILISLDHDLELMPGPHGQLLDQGTGREVADYLTGQPPGCPIVIHSTNSAAAIGMRTILQEAGWTVHRVVPFNDLEWIAAEWFPTVRRAIVGTARRVSEQPNRS